MALRARIGTALAAAALAASACTTPLELGERRYRAGDSRGALEIWRDVRPDATYYPKVRRRIEAVESEFQQLVVRYEKRAVYYERQGRLAESILNYRLALEIEPENGATLAHVQDLARELAAKKRAAKEALREHLEGSQLAAASGDLARLRTLDPFDSELETTSRQVEDALRGQVEELIARGRRGFTSGDYRGSRRAFEQVLELDAQNESARGYLAYIDAIRAEEARRTVARVEPAGVRDAARLPREETPLAQASDDEIRAEGQHQNALAADRAGDPYAAIRNDLRALELAPNHGEARRHLAELRARLEPEVAQLVATGRQHYQQEELHSALDAWRRALLIDPGNEEARAYVGRAEMLLQNLERLRSEPQSSAVGAR
jgi:tetratricopeptide (TPR) repeat protein